MWRVVVVLAVLQAGAESQVTPVLAGESVALQSKVLGQTRTLLISKPDGYDTGTERYPVLYLLDGEKHFRYTAAIADFLAQSDRIPKMLVVGIASGGSRQRTHDLTPPSSVEMDNRFSPGNGGAEAFLSFVAGELIPYIEKTYRTRPYRLLAGHSFGGLFAMYALATRPALFNGYLAADPSLFWNNQAVVAQVESVLKRTAPYRADLYVSASSEGGKLPAVFARLEAALSRVESMDLRWTVKLMKDEDHQSIALPSIYRGLETIFEDWRLPDPVALFDKAGIEGIHRRFEAAGRRFGYPERKTPPFTVSLVVAALIQANRLEDAAKVLLHDRKAYPPPWNQLEAIARAYEKRGDRAAAIRFYRMSVEENPDDEFAKRKLREMR